MSTSPVVPQKPNFIAALVAKLIERVAGNKVTTIAGALVGLAGGAAAYTPYVPAKYQAQVAAGAALAGAVALALASDGKK